MLRHNEENHSTTELCCWRFNPYLFWSHNLTLFKVFVSQAFSVWIVTICWWHIMQHSSGIACQFGIVVVPLSWVTYSILSVNELSYWFLFVVKIFTVVGLDTTSKTKNATYPGGTTHISRLGGMSVNGGMRLSFFVLSTFYSVQYASRGIITESFTEVPYWSCLFEGMNLILYAAPFSLVHGISCMTV